MYAWQLILRKVMMTKESASWSERKNRPETVGTQKNRGKHELVCYKVDSTGPFGLKDQGTRGSEKKGSKVTTARLANLRSPLGT